MLVKLGLMELSVTLEEFSIRDEIPHKRWRHDDIPLEIRTYQVFG